MHVVRGYKTELDLNNEERTACLKHAGAARFAYNWGLARSIVWAWVFTIPGSALIAALCFWTVRALRS